MWCGGCSGLGSPFPTWGTPLPPQGSGAERAPKWGCALRLCSAPALFPSPLPAPKFANVIKQQGRFHLIMVMITHTNTARESNLINFNFRGLESVLMQLFITQREEKWGLAAGVCNTGHKPERRVIFQAPEAVISEQTPLILSWGHWEGLSAATPGAHVPVATRGWDQGAEALQEPLSAEDPCAL